MDRLLKRQLNYFLNDLDSADTAFRHPKFQEFLAAIDNSYEFHRKEYLLLERTIELNSKELNDANLRLIEQNKAISKLATTDALTGLPNRIVCHDRIKQTLKRVKRYGGFFSLLFIDLDRFKIINDTLGHQVGDLLLKEVAQRLLKSVRESDTVSRLGGDEFTVLLDNVSEANRADKIAKMILSTLSEPYWIEGRELNITASIGIGIYPTDGDCIVDIFKSADTAMYRVKENGRNNYKAYDPSMQDEAVKTMELESSLRKALDRNELCIHYQPKLNTTTGKLYGTEALLRWKSAEFGMIPPVQFIPIAEESGLIIPIGEWVLLNACTQNRKWQDGGLRPMSVAVNISGVQLSHPDFIASIDRALFQSGLSSEYLELEITESMIMQQEGIVMENIYSLKERNIMLSIDDFGTGYSSLSTIKQFPIDTLKIDQSFVRDIVEDPDDAAIVTAIIAMAKSLKLNVIAEGVETAKQFERLTNSGCNLIQGYWVSRPLEADALEELLKRDPYYSIGDTTCHKTDKVRAIGNSL